MKLLRSFLAATLLFIPVAAAVAYSVPVSAENLNAEVCEAAKDSINNDTPIFCEDMPGTSNPIFGPEGIITKATQALVYAIAAISVIIIIVGGIRYIVSAGDPNATKGAKDSILYAVIGLVVAIFAQTLVAFVLSRL